MAGLGDKLSGVIGGGDSSSTKIPEVHPETKEFTPGQIANPNSYKRGGKVKKSGVAKVHRGERVLTKSETRKYDAKKRGRKR